MTVDQAAKEFHKWFKFSVGLLLLVLVAISATDLLFNLEAVNGIPLTQNAGIGAAGLGFLYSKL